MPRFKLCIEYQGTRYSGWQIQTNARTVQGEIVSALRKVTGLAEFEFHGAGRTDAGVHALRQVAHLDVAAKIEPGILLRRLNDELPHDINILEVEPVPGRFHARHHAVSRSYLYQISRRRTAFAKKFVWWIKDPLDMEQMKSAAELFVGMKDFASFSAEDREEKSTRVLVEHIELREAGDLILIRVQGSHFLWRMVRRIVGVLVETGKGGLALTDLRRFLRTRSEEPARLAAPASGLFLERVYYQGEPRRAALVPAIPVVRSTEKESLERPV